jgi:hypothetical protein
MFPGFFVGTIFLFWLVRTLMWGPRYRYWGYGHHHRRWGRAYGPSESLWGDFGGFDDPGPTRDAGTNPRARVEPKSADRASAPFGRDDLEQAVGGFVRALRDRLRATPRQERAFDTAVTKLRDAMDDAQARMKEARDDIARAVRGKAFDESAFDAAASRIEEAMQAIRGAARSALADVHDQLDERQRETLGDLISSHRVDL